MELGSIITTHLKNIGDTIIVVAEDDVDKGWDRKLLSRRNWGIAISNLDGFGCAVADWQLSKTYCISSNQVWSWGWDSFEMQKIDEPDFVTSAGAALMETK